MIALKNKVNNENGLTLIELLASMTILSIVILTFLAFFTNAFRFNTINSDGIQAMNIAREQKALIQDYSNKGKMINTFLTENSYNPVLNEPNVYSKIDNSGYEIIVSINKNYENDINFYHKLDVFHVEVKKNDKLQSQTYTYYEEKGGV